MRKEFSDLDKDTFISEAFNFMARYFEGSLVALSERHPEFAGRFERIDTRRFTASIYKSGSAVAECTVTLDGYGRGASEIRYAEGITLRTSGYNEALMVASDSQKLFLKATMSMMGHAGDQNLSDSGAAEYLWTKFIDRLQ